MEKNNSSNSCVCRKIREALESSHALRAIHRISSYHQEPRPVTTGSNSPSSSPTKTATQTKPPLPQHLKVNTEGAGVIPINFDYSTPTSVANRNSAVSSVHGQAAKVASPLVGNSERAAKVEPHTQYVPMQEKPPKKTEVVVFPTNAGTVQGGQGTKAAAFKGEEKGKPKVEAAGPFGGHHGHHGVHSEQQGKTSQDINDTFKEYIERAKYKIKTVSNIGRGQSNPPPDHEANGTNKNENQKDHFSDFIHRAKKKFRATSSIGKTTSLKRG